MQWPLPEPETLCAGLWHALPPETVPRARACKALGRAKQGKPPEHLLRVGVVSWGWDNP